MTTEQSIILGVVSGVVTATFIFLAKEFWFKTLLPWYQGFRYQGADISGSWFAEYNDSDGVNSKSTYSVVLKQSAHRISGSMQVTFVSDERKFNINYRLVGEYWEGYLNLTCRSKDRKMYAHGSMFLKLINNGYAFLGQFNFRHAFDDKVFTIPLGIDRN
jgi:hypothetical protein